MEKSTGPWRYRLNVSQSVKGIETSDATIEYAGVRGEVRAPAIYPRHNAELRWRRNARR